MTKRNGACVHHRETYYLTKAEITNPSNMATAGSWISVSNVTKKGHDYFEVFLGNFLIQDKEQMKQSGVHS